MFEETGVVVSNSSRSLSGLFAAQGLSFWVTIGALIIVVLRILSIIRVAKDIMARTNKLGLQMISVVLVTFLSPVLGLPIYLVIRPIGFIWDKLPWRESSVMTLVVCYNCRTLNPKDHEYCISCGEGLKIKCKQCAKNFPHSYGYCNFCGAPNIE